jgi:hypothetical protein
MERVRQLAEDTFARCRRVFGDDNPDTLDAAHHLAICLHVMGSFEQARQLNLEPSPADVEYSARTTSTPGALPTTSPAICVSG